MLTVDDRVVHGEGGLVLMMPSSVLAELAVLQQIDNDKVVDDWWEERFIPAQQTLTLFYQQLKEVNEERESAGRPVFTVPTVEMYAVAPPSVVRVLDRAWERRRIAMTA